MTWKIWHDLWRRQSPTKTPSPEEAHEPIPERTPRQKILDAIQDACLREAIVVHLENDEQAADVLAIATPAIRAAIERAYDAGIKTMCDGMRFTGPTINGF